MKFVLLVIKPKDKHSAAETEEALELKRFFRRIPVDRGLGIKR